MAHIGKDLLLCWRRERRSREESGTIARSLCLPVIGVCWRIERDDCGCGNGVLTDVKGILSEDELDDLILYVALHPEAGDVIRETAACGNYDGQRKVGAKRRRSPVPYGD